MAYRIKHLPTGLYYCPTRELRAPGWTHGYVKSNLSKNGKAYLKLPTIRWIGKKIWSHLAIEMPPRPPAGSFARPKSALIDAWESDWEIEEI